MKKTINLSIIILLLFTTTAWSQENVFSLSGGYSFANIEDVVVNANGFRINGLYEYNPSEGKWAHGFSVGYIGLTATSEDGLQDIDYKLNSWPIYYAPKFMIGEDSFKGFAKGAIGMHISSYKRTGSLSELKTSSAGFYGGLSLGVMQKIGETIFMNLEYEWAYMSNTSYTDGFMNSILLGFGMRF